MKLDLSFAEIHAPLFLLGEKGVNLGTKLNPKERHGLKLVYDREQKELVVTFQGMEAIVPVTNVACMHVAKGVEVKVAPQAVKAAQKADTPVQPQVGGPGDVGFNKPAVPPAQVDSPQAHVFAGPGKGQTGQEPPKGKGK